METSPFGSSLFNPNKTLVDQTLTDPAMSSFFASGHDTAEVPAFPFGEEKPGRPVRVESSTDTSFGDPAFPLGPDADRYRSSNNPWKNVGANSKPPIEGIPVRVEPPSDERDTNPNLPAFDNMISPTPTGGLPPDGKTIKGYEVVYPPNPNKTVIDPVMLAFIPDGKNGFVPTEIKPMENGSQAFGEPLVDGGDPNGRSRTRPGILGNTGDNNARILEVPPEVVAAAAKVEKENVQDKLSKLMFNAKPGFFGSKEEGSDENAQKVWTFWNSYINRISTQAHFSQIKRAYDFFIMAPRTFSNPKGGVQYELLGTKFITSDQEVTGLFDLALSYRPQLRIDDTDRTRSLFVILRQNINGLFDFNSPRIPPLE